ncbi:hypothetical protein [Agrobacterium tumefaciens]|uniref:hypothetical protein n=1 Tax=Agrobacterium tumefaciens TaxID=358 RepID=UPI003B9EAA33
MAISSPYVAFRCTECDEVVSEECDLPPYDLMADTGGDAVGTEDLEVVCPYCETEHEITITAWQLNYWEVESRHPMLRQKKIFLHVPPQFDDEDEFEMFLEDERLDDPYRIFVRSSSGLHALAKVDLVNERLEQAQLRMMYANYIATLEAYLCDRLISLVTYSDAVLKKFLSAHRKLGTKTIPLQAILGNPSIVIEQVEEHLKSQLYHKVDVVTELYRDAFGIDVFKNSDRKVALEAAIKLRHDIVHRNGRAKDGVMISIDHSMVTRVNMLVGGLVNEVETALEELIKEKSFYEFEHPRPKVYEPVDDASEEEIEAAGE